MCCYFLGSERETQAALQHSYILERSINLLPQGTLNLDKAILPLFMHPQFSVEH